MPLPTWTRQLFIVHHHTDKGPQSESFPELPFCLDTRGCLLLRYPVDSSDPMVGGCKGAGGAVISTPLLLGYLLDCSSSSFPALCWGSLCVRDQISTTNTSDGQCDPLASTPVPHRAAADSQGQLPALESVYSHCVTGSVCLPSAACCLPHLPSCQCQFGPTVSVHAFLQPAFSSAIYWTVVWQLEQRQLQFTARGVSSLLDRWQGVSRAEPNWMDTASTQSPMSWADVQ